MLAKRTLLILGAVLSIARAAAAATTIEINDATDTLHNTLPADCANSGTGTCSLRDAILFANFTGSSGQPYTFKFDQLGAGSHTITLSNAPQHGSLDAITVTVVIDGTTHPDGKVELSGVNLTSGSPAGFVLNGTGASTVKGMVINHFGGDGIDVGASAAGSLITGNFLGTDYLGTSAAGNGGDGLDVNATLVTVNSNVISGNGQFGLHIFGSFLPTANAVNVQNNKIGTDVTGLAALGNTSDGIRIDTGANGNIIGGANVVSGNGGNGIFINGNGNFPGLNVISGNFIGTRIGGVLGSIPNTLDGIRMDQSNFNILGGGPFGGNLISGNTKNGIEINDSDSNLVVNNIIGLDALGGLGGAEGNGGDGILIAISTNTDIGGPGGVATFNVISSNTGAGVHINGQAGTTTGNIVEGNIIGANVSGIASGNGIGVFVEGDNANNTTIGGSSSNQANTIAFNTGPGVRIGINASDFVTPVDILSNSIHDNGALGIDLGNDGVTNNDPGDIDVAAPNEFQNFPAFTLALISNATGKVLIQGAQDSQQAINQIQMFLAAADPSGHGEGKTLILDQTGVPNGPFSFGPSTPSSAVAAGNLLTATATTADGTSEFSLNIPFVANVPPVANAGPNQNQPTGATVVLDGSASVDPDGLPSGPAIVNGNFTWVQTGGPAAGRPDQSHQRQSDVRRRRSRLLRVLARGHRRHGRLDQSRLGHDHGHLPELDGSRLQRESVGLRAVGDLHGDGDRDGPGSHGHGDVLRRSDEHRIRSAQRRRSGAAHDVHPGGRKPPHHGGLRRRRQLHRQHIARGRPGGQPGQHDDGCRLERQSVRLRPARELHRDGNSSPARLGDAHGHRLVLRRGDPPGHPGVDRERGGGLDDGRPDRGQPSDHRGLQRGRRTSPEASRRSSPRSSTRTTRRRW